MGSVTLIFGRMNGMKQHVYQFNFNYHKQVNGKKQEFIVPINTHNTCYVDACTEVDEFVQKNFAEYITEESTIKYVGEFVPGVLKPFVEVKEETDVKMFDEMKIKKSKVEMAEMIVRLKEEVMHERRDRCALVKDGYLLREEVQELKEKIEDYKSVNNSLCYEHGKTMEENRELGSQIHQLQKRVDGFKAKANYMGGFTFVQGSRGSGKKEFEKQRLMLNGFMYTDNTLDDIIEKIKNTQPQIFDVKIFDANSMYPQAVDVCKVYQIERDQALKENEALQKRVKYLIERNNRFEVNEKYYDEEYRKLSDEKQTHEMVINGYKKELSQLNLLMDDMENRLEKQVVARDGMLKQLREYKTEKKRMNKTIDIIQAENETLKSRMLDSDNSEIKALQEQIKELKENHELSVQLIKRLNGDKQRLIDSIGIIDLNRFFEEGL